MIELAKEISARRRPRWTGENTENIDSFWLFQADVSKFVEDWVRLVNRREAIKLAGGLFIFAFLRYFHLYKLHVIFKCSGN